MDTAATQSKIISIMNSSATDTILWDPSLSRSRPSSCSTPSAKALWSEVVCGGKRVKSRVTSPPQPGKSSASGLPSPQPAMVQPPSSTTCSRATNHHRPASPLAPSSPHLPPDAQAASTANGSSLFRSQPPQYILIGDSMVRSVPIPNGITYSFSGVNDLRCRQSTKLHADYELLAETIERLGKICIFSRLIPTLRRGSEMFSRLYSANQWLSNFCAACGYGFINNFDSLWKKTHLYRYDNLHLNNKGISVLASHLSNHLSSLAD
uniref:SGNH hydrolase-type esterase domain-containing protein n=1 Tax=Myripristis murdjan TaxID=586833 RepID=A0A667WZR1_9TELE